jgi:hypothetical protein
MQSRSGIPATFPIRQAAESRFYFELRFLRIDTVRQRFFNRTDETDFLRSDHCRFEI